jgi:hypothetical protein
MQLGVVPLVNVTVCYSSDLLCRLMRGLDSSDSLSSIWMVNDNILTPSILA